MRVPVCHGDIRREHRPLRPSAWPSFGSTWLSTATAIWILCREKLVMYLSLSYSTASIPFSRNHTLELGRLCGFGALTWIDDCSFGTSATCTGVNTLVNNGVPMRDAGLRIESGVPALGTSGSVSSGMAFQSVFAVGDVVADAGLTGRREALDADAGEPERTMFSSAIVGKVWARERGGGNCE
ncbi:hypothetical protein EJ03DRAFT_54671 [Teratosphaeria nubilosa]|uniref:Uncharacterized protein n=1 Tax=Teratosphaeria nubilosa TaxID=161662 RepID=A0A6G1LE75_9PEZI|nr:hypothetical protein EJ03DRAFT_54671 [Teratosphaeria nubilosa]